MSSSAEPSWDAFALRDEPAGLDEPLSPASEVAAVIQRSRADVDAARAEGAQSAQEARETVALLAVRAFQLGQALERYAAPLEAAGLPRVHRHLRVVKDQMLEAVAAAGLTVLDPTGRAFDEVAEWVHVDGWRTAEGLPREQVAEASEPVVLAGTVPIRLGRVVMGAPPPPSEGSH